MKWRKSALFKFEILGLIVNRLTADDKYSRRNIQNLTQELSNGYIPQTKDFFWNFYYVSQIYNKFRGFSKKVESASLSISQINDAGKSGYLNV